MTPPSVIPYVVGQWVRGSRFYGRAALIAEVLDGHRDSLWLLGVRRIGKTSLLRQIELVTTDESRGYFPLFWDLQGAEDDRDLTLSFHDALLDVEDRLANQEIAVEDIAGDDLATSITKMRRRLRDRELTPLLLCDEVEALIGIQRSNPSLLRKLSRLLGGAEGMRTVIASTIRLLEISGRDGASSFLDDFTPPLYVSGLDDDEARALIRQMHEDENTRPGLEEADVERIRALCGNHPYLMQLLSKRFLEIGSLDHAREQVQSDPMLGHFFSNDFETLDDDERVLLELLGRHGQADESVLRTEMELGKGQLSIVSRRLERLGLISTDAHRISISVPLFRSWLTQLPVAKRGLKSDDGGDAPRIGDWAIRQDLNEIRRGRGSVRLEPRAMNLLVYLASRRGRVTGKDQILDTIWNGVFVSESALTRTIADLRKALGDDARNPQYIETISKRGYRLVAPVIGDFTSGGPSQSLPSGPARGTTGRIFLCRGRETLPIAGGEHWIGRDPVCMVSIASPKVSRRHARLIVSSEGVTIDDLESRNGTFVNGHRITESRKLQNGDQILIGPETLIFREFDPAEVTESDLAVPERTRGEND